MPKGKYNQFSNISPEERFFNAVIPEPMSGCWLWIERGVIDLQGRCYGRFRVDGKLILAHRFAYEMTFGPIPEGMCCLHKCDTPECVNPYHLFLGTRIDNNKDMMNKKRNNQPKGIKSGNAKLTDEDIIKIRSDNRPKRTIAKEYNVSPPLISYIQLRKVWKHI